MKNKVKIFLIIILVILLVYVIYVSIDCIRLKNAKTGTKPFITVSEKETENRIIYKGLGYSIEYYINIENQEEEEIDFVEIKGYGAEFRLFDGILIWAWIE